MTLSQQLFDELAQAIRDGHLKPGGRLPSVREACRQRSVSPATIFLAYGRLESSGLIEARVRSGFYVRAARRGTRALPVTAEPRVEATPVEIGELAFELLDTTRVGEVTALGSAFPSAALFPFDALARCGARAMRRLRPQQQIGGSLIAGDPGLREALRLRYVQQGVPIADGEIVITDGGLEALNLCLEAVTKPGDVVAVESPTFYAALQALERLHLKAVEVATDPVTGVDLASLTTILEREPRLRACWFMTTFQNPLGALMPTPRKRQLVQLLASHQVPLIEDDVYGELYDGASGHRPPPAKAFDRDGTVLHCSSFSKCLAPGYRVGWAAAGRHAGVVQRLKMMSTLATSLPPQLAIAEYLGTGGYDRHLRRLREALSRQRQRALRLIERHFPAGTRITRPEGGYFLWVQLPQGVDALALHREALTRYRISTAPGVLFSADRRFVQHLRLNVSAASDEGGRFDDACRLLGRLATEQAG